MPGFNGTGPQGMGPMTGGGRGFCNQANLGNRPRFAGGMGMGLRRGFRGGGNDGMRGMRRGVGRGYGNSPYAYDASPMDDVTDLDMLKADAETMKRNLEMINRRIADIEKET